MGGAWLIAMWAVGLVLIVFAVMVGADAVLRERAPASRTDEMRTRHEEILDRWREAK